MHVSLQQGGENSKNLQRITDKHMQSALPLAITENTGPVVADRHSPLTSPIKITTAGDSFFKDGRKISVGDCALFKPSQDSPPFIGLIRWLTLSKENNLQLGVSWLYRRTELKLINDTLVDCAPNEIFYSFHKDETPAASLLHPCKVAFLPKGVELLNGKSSFVCRRVYDITKQCLWWLTDQDFIKEQQKEVDQLIYKTRTEMHATSQPDSRSPKQVNGPISTSQLKPASDSAQSNGSFPSQTKGKKRERVDHSTDPIKRERSLRSDDDEHFQYSNFKSEIALITEKGGTEKGGIVNLEEVDEIVHQMQSDKRERNIDLFSRSKLAGAIAATDRVDCLNRFVKLRGLPVLDEWLQEIHKAKTGDGNSLKDGDKSTEEFILVLLRALDKLPVNLHALQMCNIGRSVNHLRSHKNFEIQRKARTLVDTWKKRVEAEMNSIDTKSGSTRGVSAWQSKSRFPEASHAGSRTPIVSDVALKCSVTHNSASKTTSSRSTHGESIIKSACSSPGPVKPVSSPASCKESQPTITVGGTSDVPLVREDRSSSNQSQNYSQSFSGKEEGKSSTASVVNVNRISTRNRKTSSVSVSVNGSPKEISSCRSSSVHKTTSLDKLSQSNVSSERVLDGHITEGSSHKLVVKIPNRVQSPSQGLGGESHEDPCISSRASSPVLVHKPEHFVRISKDKNDIYRSNIAAEIDVGLLQNSCSKVGLTRSAESDAAPAGEHSMMTEDSPTNQLNSGKLLASSFSPMNALIESCARYSEANSSLSPVDDVGMNLLASVATGEMLRSDLVSPIGSTERSTPAMERVCSDDELKSNSSPKDLIDGVQSQSYIDAKSNDKKPAVLDGCSWPENGLDLSKQVPPEFSGDKKCVQSHASEEMPLVLANKQLGSVSTNTSCDADIKRDVPIRSAERTITLSSTHPTSTEKVKNGDSNGVIHENGISSNFTDGISTCERDGINVVMSEIKSSTDLLNSEGKLIVDVVESDQFSEAGCKKDLVEGLNMGTNSQQKLFSACIESEFAERANDEKLQQASNGQESVIEAAIEVKIGKLDENDFKECLTKSEVDKNAAGGSNGAGLCSTSNDLSHQEVANVEGKKIIGNPGYIDHEAQQKDDLGGSKSSSFQADEEMESAPGDSSSSAAGASDLEAKIKFDLNEGFSAEDGKYEEPVSLISSVATNAHMISSSPISVNYIPIGHSASITVAAAAKGSFVPTEDLLRNKGELRWKGSAATSAFRPAEPRKTHETPLDSTNMSRPDVAANKDDRLPLDFDLNVADERVLEEMASRDSALAIDSTSDIVNNHATLPNKSSRAGPVRSSGWLDLDLNRMDAENDDGHCSTSSNHKGEGSILHAKPLDCLPTDDVRRDFDLNDGPGVDDTSTDQLIFNKQINGGAPSPLSHAGLRMYSPGLGSFSSWFPSGSTYSTMAIPSMLPDRGEQPYPTYPPGASQRTFGPPGVNPYASNVCRGSVLSSSPAIPFPSSPFQFPVFPFGTSFPLPSATYSVGGTSYLDSASGPRLFAPPVNSQLLGPVGSVAPQFHRQYMVNLSDSNSGGGLEDNRKWGLQGLDLNAGPGAMESEVREELLPLSSVQRSITSPQALAEEHARMYSAAGGTLKRKEPEGGWENESFRYMQSSRQ